MAAPKSGVLAGDDVGALVIDCGSWLVRAGPAGDDVPRALHAPALGLCAAPADGGPPRRVVGDRLQLAPLAVTDVRAVHQYDVSSGGATVADWDAMQAVWASAAAAAGVDPTAGPLLLVEPTRRWARGDPDRAAALERAFEGLGVPAAYVARGAAMAAFASVRTTACVVDVGHQGATAVPVVDGYALDKSTVSSSVGGQYLSDALYRVLDEMLSRGNPAAGAGHTVPPADADNSTNRNTSADDPRVPIGSLHAKLRALHEVRRTRKPPSPALAGIDPEIRQYDVEDLALHDPQRNFTDHHRAFYRMRLLDDIKASLFRVSLGSQAQPKKASNSNGGLGAMGEESNDVLMSDANNDTDGNAGTEGKPESSHAGPRDSADGLGLAASGASGDKDLKEGDRDMEREREIEKARERGHGPGSTIYELPDGNFIDGSVGGTALLADALFLNGQADDPFRRAISNLAFDAITACDMDMRRELYAGIVLTGGCTLIPGAIERFTREMAVLTPQLFKMKIIAAQASIQRTAGPWIGGSIVASLGTFQQAWVSKAEYDELGAMGSLRKCP
jgi:hypothetical protein